MRARSLALVVFAAALVAAVLGAGPADAGRDDLNLSRVGAGTLRPWRVLFVGDSLTTQSEAALRALLDGRAEVHVRAHPGSGLLNRRWLDDMASLVESVDPDIVVAEFVGNYFPPYIRRLDNGAEILPGSSEYYGLWAGAAHEATHRLQDRGAEIHWVLGPHMRDPGLDRMRMLVDVVYLGLDPALEVRYVDGYRPLSGPDGRYTDTMPGPGGRPVAVRAADGIHLTAEGARRFATAIVDALAADYKL